MRISRNTDLMIIHDFVFDVNIVTGIGSKAIPLQVWTGPEGSRRLRLPDFKTIST